MLALTSERLVWAGDCLNDKDTNTKRAATTVPTFLNLTCLNLTCLNLTCLNLTCLNMGLLITVICRKLIARHQLIGSARPHCFRTSSSVDPGEIVPMPNVMPGMCDDEVKI